MSQNNFGGLMMDVLSKKASKEEIRDFLSRFTDEDFNGNNGEEYFTEITHNGVTKLVSNLDACMYDIEKYDELEKFIAYVFKCNYGDDTYYTEYAYDFKTFGDDIVVALATQYYN